MPLVLQPGCMDLILKRRRGFVRVALEAGADLVPVRPGWCWWCVCVCV